MIQIDDNDYLKFVYGLYGVRKIEQLEFKNGNIYDFRDDNLKIISCN